MQYGSTPGVSNRVSRLVLGSIMFSTAPEEFDNTCRLLDRFVAVGGTTVDTARAYSGGTAEAALGKWLQQSGRRAKMGIVGEGAPHDSKTLERRVTPAAIHQDPEASLQAMQIETIDVYILHRDDP